MYSDRIYELAVQKNCRAFSFDDAKTAAQPATAVAVMREAKLIFN